MSEALDYKRKIVLVEDDNLTRNILGEHLKGAGFDVLTAASASQAEILCAEFDPDAVVLDVDLGPGPTGFDLADSLRISSPGIAILFLTHLPDSRFGGRSAANLPEGAAYLNKNQLADGSALVVALDAVLRGITSRVPRHDQDPHRPLATLSSSQIAVLRMIALGMSNSQIAEERGTTTRAVYGLISRTMSSIGSDEDSEGAGRVLAARTYMLAAGIPLAN